MKAFALLRMCIGESSCVLRGRKDDMACTLLMHTQLLVWLHKSFTHMILC